MKATKLQIILGLAGKKRSGKTTAAMAICSHWRDTGLMPIRLGFSDALKDMVGNMMGSYEAEHKPFLRPVYQSVGQAMKDLHGQNYWVEQWKSRHDKYVYQGFNAFVVDDVRFPFEAEFIRSIGGSVIKIDRPNLVDDGDRHTSETSVEDVVADHIVTNTTLGSFVSAVTNCI